MRSSWLKLVSTLALCLAIGVIAVACSESAEQVAPTASDAGSTLEAVLGGDKLLTPSCGGGNQTPYVDEIAVSCVEIWGPSNHVPYSLTGDNWATYTCKAWGTAVGGPAFGQYRLVGTPSSEIFTTYGTGLVNAQTLDAMYFTLKAYGTRPTTPSTIVCMIDGIQATLPVTIDGSAPYMTSVTIFAPKTTITAGEDLDLTAHYWDNYGYHDYFTPTPSHTWTSSNPSVATIDASTGRVHGVAIGSTTIQLAATTTSGTKFATVNITVTAAGCSLATTPNGTVNTFQGGSVSISATATCASGYTLPPGNWTWPITGPITVSNDNSQNSLVHTVGQGPGIATTKVCTPAGASQICSPIMTFQLYATRITSALDGTTQTPGINASGSIDFTITNVSPIAGTSNVTCSGGYGPVACNSVTPTSVTLQPNQSKTVTANWTTGTTTGSGAVGVSSTGGGNDGIYFNIVGGAVTTTIHYGPSSVQPGVNCEWMASANGGTPPYTYQWTVDGDPVSGSGNDLYYVNLRRNFTLGITATDANGVTATNSKAITVTSSAPYCPL